MYIGTELSKVESEDRLVVKASFIFNYRLHFCFIDQIVLIDLVLAPASAIAGASGAAAAGARTAAAGALSAVCKERHRYKLNGNGQQIFLLISCSGYCN